MNRSPAKLRLYLPISEDKNLILTWKQGIQVGLPVSPGQPLATYAPQGVQNPHPTTLTSPIFGKIVSLAPSGLILDPIDVCVLEPCSHQFLNQKNVCSFCGAKLDSVGVLGPEKLKGGGLYNGGDRLVLALDLDNTLLHAELVGKEGYDPVDISSIDVRKENGVYMLDMGCETLVVKLRPYLGDFLEKMSRKYQIFLCTRGKRVYVDRLLQWIDPGRQYIFPERIISGEELGECKGKALGRVIGDMKKVLVLDDTPELWGRAWKKVVFTKPFYYFKMEDDDRLVVRREIDVFLLFVGNLLGFIERVYSRWPFRKPRISVGEVYQEVKGSLFTGKSFGFFGMFKDIEEMQRSREYQDLRKLGGKDMRIDNVDGADIVFSKAGRELEGVRKSKALVVSTLYINYCEMLCTPLDPRLFDLREKDSIIVELEEILSGDKGEDAKEWEKRKNYLLDQMEKRLIEEAPSVKVFEGIGDIVIEKMKRRMFERKKRTGEREGRQEAVDMPALDNEEDGELSGNCEKRVKK